MNEDIGQEWHQMLSERNRLRDRVAVLTDTLRRHHEENHRGAARWCEAAPCRLLFGFR